MFSANFICSEAKQIKKREKKATSFLWLQPLSIHLKRVHGQCTHQLVIHPDNTQVYQCPSDASQIF